MISPACLLLQKSLLLHRILSVGPLEFLWVWWWWWWFYLHEMMSGWRLQLNPFIWPNRGSSTSKSREWLEIVQLRRVIDTNLRPHIKLYHTIVPCRWCWDGETDWGGGSGEFIWMDVCIWSFCWFSPIDDPPSAGLIPLLMHGTPMIGVGSSGGVT